MSPGCNYFEKQKHMNKLVVKHTNSLFVKTNFLFGSWPSLASHMKSVMSIWFAGTVSRIALVMVARMACWHCVRYCS
jgi:hypothetical protein